MSCYERGECGEFAKVLFTSIAMNSVHQLMKPKSFLSLSLILGAIGWSAFTSCGQTVTKMSAGTFYSLFLKQDGSLWGMGESFAGQLGDGASNNTVKFPEQVLAGNVTAIAAAAQHSLFLR